MDDKVQKIGLGTVQFGIPYGISNQRGQTSPKEVARILETAREKQIQFIDTAPAYGNAERLLGQNDLSTFKVISKFMPPESGGSVSDQLKQSLDDLKISSVYGYLAHRPKHLAENVSIWKELKSLKEKELVQNIGVSLNKPYYLEVLLGKNITPDIIQVPFNYFDRRFKDLMISLKKGGCEIHARSTFLQGLFFMDIDQLDSYFDPFIPVLENLQETVENLPGALLNFVLSQPFIDTVIIGVENNEQFIQNLDSLATLSSLPKLTTKIPESILIPSNWPS
ncbi:MAG: aldo/keto reductase [Balneolaceae bacterium]|nr:aldo/keto reductase [Balneolaceae bacterium]MDR9410664.1 aldo/keto reductase [Balneolaceae bacterium]